MRTNLRCFLAIVNADGKVGSVVIGGKRLLVAGGVWWLPLRLVGEMQARGVAMNGAWVSPS